MEKREPGQNRNERPNDVEEERTDKGGLKVRTKTQGLKSDHNKLREEDPIEAHEEDDDAAEEDEDEDG